jgi:outer membrane protein assembly factor BamA
VTSGWLSAEVNSRAEEIQQARREKAAEATPEVAPKGEQRLNWIQDSHILERFATGYHGLTVVLGGLGTGQGFALGPQYLKDQLLDGNLVFRTSARASSSRAYLIDMQATLPKLANERVFLDFYARHRNYPRTDYFGPGPDSKEGSRAHFLLEDTSADFTLGARPFRNLSVGVTGGLLAVNTGRGSNDDVADIRDLFTPATTPGLDNQSDFLRAGVFAQFDYRDNPGGPRSGGNYVAKFVNYDDRDLGLHDHRRLDLEAQQYFPFFNGRRVIALRARTVMTYTNGNQTVPFYLQPTLGGSDDLRGFRPYRFYDNNHIVVNAEYRWEAFTGLDMALFFDAGKVAPKPSQINFHDLEGSAGVGFRFNIQNNVFLRLDVGASHERTMIWFVFGHVF